MEKIKYWFSLNKEVKEISQLASPLVVTQLAQVALSTIDIVMLGILGTRALAAGGLAITVFALLRTFGNGMISVMSNLIAYERGRDSSGEIISRVVRAGFGVALLLSVIFYGLAWFVKPVLVEAGQDGKIIPETVEYLRIMMLGMLPCLWFLVLRNFTVGLRHSGRLMVFTLISIVLKVIINFIFMFGYLGFPALGMMGIAWSSDVVFLLSFLLFAISVARKSDYSAFQLFSRVWVFKVSEVVHILCSGLPLAITYFAEAGFFMVIALLMGRISEVALAANTVVNQCVYTTFMVAVGISHAASMSIGHAYGAGKVALVRRYGHAALLIGLVCMGIMGLLFWLLNQEIMRFFIDPNSGLNAEVFRLGSSLLIVAAVFQIFDGWQNIAVGMLRGIKAMKLSMVVSLVGYWLIGLPLAYGFGFYIRYGGIGVWWGLAAGLAITAFLLIFSFEKRLKHLQS